MGFLARKTIRRASFQESRVKVSPQGPCRPAAPRQLLVVESDKVKRDGHDRDLDARTDASARMSPNRFRARERRNRELCSTTFDYSGLHRWSLARRAAFWSRVWEFCGVIGERGARTLVDGGKMPGARWFPDARLNFAENLLRPRPDDEVAIVFQGERQSWTNAVLRANSNGGRRAGRAFARVGRRARRSRRRLYA